MDDLQSQLDDLKQKVSELEGNTGSVSQFVPKGQAWNLVSPQSIDPGHLHTKLVTSAGSSVFNVSASSGNLTGLLLGEGTNALSALPGTQGDIPYRASGDFTLLGAGTTGQFLKISANAPQWATVNTIGLFYSNNTSDNLSDSSGGTEATYKTISIPGNTMGANGIIRITMWGKNTNANPLFILGYYGSGSSFFKVQTAGNERFWLQASMWNQNATNAQIGNGKIFNSSTLYTDPNANTAAVDSTANQNLVIKYTSVNAVLSTMTIDLVQVEILK